MEHRQLEELVEQALPRIRAELPSSAWKQTAVRGVLSEQFGIDLPETLEKEIEQILLSRNDVRKAGVGQVWKFGPPRLHRSRSLRSGT